MINATTHPDAPRVIATVVLNAGKALGLEREKTGRIVGRDRSRLRDGLDPRSPGGQAALLLLRCHRSLYALVDGDLADRAVLQFAIEASRTAGLPGTDRFDDLLSRACVIRATRRA